LILNLQWSPGNFPFFSQWRYLCHTSDFFAYSLIRFFADLLTADSLISIFEGGAMAKEHASPGVALGEDWLAFIIGLVLAALVWIGVIVKIPWPVSGWFK